jgi:hypothetical protein
MGQPLEPGVGYPQHGNEKVLHEYKQQLHYLQVLRHVRHENGRGVLCSTVNVVHSSKSVPSELWVRRCSEVKQQGKLRKITRQMAPDSHAVVPIAANTHTDKQGKQGTQKRVNVQWSSTADQGYHHSKCRSSPRTGRRGSQVLFQLSAWDLWQFQLCHK